MFKGEHQMVWMNVDKPTRNCTLHSNCTYLRNKKETQLKGVGELKRDGGWLSFKNRNEALKFYKGEYSEFLLIDHC
jgi:acyl-coenzyme A thioesterase PaaI-like protein